MKLFKDPADNGKVKAYHTAQYNWLKQTFEPLTDKDAQDAELARLDALRKSAKDALPEKADKKLIDEYVSATRNFKDLKKDKFDTATGLNQQCIDDGNCTDQDVVDITRKYVEADYAYQVKKTAQEKAAGVVKSTTDTIDDHTFATITTCDAKEGIIHKEYDADSCEGEPLTTFKAQWGACVQAPDAKNFIKVTGAAALQAAAVAVVAFAGSQF